VICSCSVKHCLNLKKAIFRFSYKGKKERIGQCIEQQQQTLVADEPSLQTEWWLVFGSYQTVLHTPLVTIKGAAQSVCRPCMNSGETLYNNNMHAISTERLRTCKALK